MRSSIVKKGLKAIEKAGDLNIISKAEQRKVAMQKYREEARRKVSLANKRIRRLEARGLENSPAYQSLIANGEKRFSVRGKDYNQLQQEVARMDRFINATTSTLTGVKSYVKTMADNIGMTNADPKTIMQNASKFFELASKAEQYLNQISAISAIMDSQRILTTINEYVQESKTDLSDINTNIDDMIELISTRIIEADMEEAEKAYQAEDTTWFKP